MTNGGFERGRSRNGRAPAAWKKGAAIAGVQYLWDRDVAHQGHASLHLKKTAQRYFPIAQWSQEVKHQGKATRLKVVAFVKAQKTTKAILDVQFLDRSGKWSHKWAVYIGAKESGDPPVTHDWKKYEGVVAIPDGTEKIIIAPQIYGPGDVWFDDVVAEYTDAEPTDPTASNPPAGSSRGPSPDLADIADVPSEERKAGDDPRKRYFLIGPRAGSAPRRPRAIGSWWSCPAATGVPTSTRSCGGSPSSGCRPATSSPSRRRLVVARAGQGHRLADGDGPAARRRVHDRGVRRGGDRRRVADEEG